MNWLAACQIILAGIGFGFLGIFGKLAFQNDLNVGELLFWRFLFASLILWFVILNFKPRLIKLSLQQIIYSVFLGVFGYAIFSTLYFESMKGMSVALAAMILFTFPIFVSLGAHFLLKEIMTKTQWLSLLLACIGLLLLLWGDIFFESYRAVFFALSAAISYSIYVLVSARAQKNVDPLSSSLYIISSAALALYFYHQPDLNRIFNFNLNQYMIIIGIAIFCSIMPMTLFLAGLQKIKSSQASLIVMIEPVVAAFAAWILLGEHLSTRQVLGSCLVILSLFLNSFTKAISKN